MASVVVPAVEREMLEATKATKAGVSFHRIELVDRSQARPNPDSEPSVHVTYNRKLEPVVREIVKGGVKDTEILIVNAVSPLGPGKSLRGMGMDDYLCWRKAGNLLSVHRYADKHGCYNRPDMAHLFYGYEGFDGLSVNILNVAPPVRDVNYDHLKVRTSFYSWMVSLFKTIAGQHKQYKVVCIDLIGARAQHGHSWNFVAGVLQDATTHLHPSQTVHVINMAPNSSKASRKFLDPTSPEGIARHKANLEKKLAAAKHEEMLELLAREAEEERLLEEKYTYDRESGHRLVWSDSDDRSLQSGGRLVFGST